VLFDKIKRWNSLLARGGELFYAAKEMCFVFVIIIRPTLQVALEEHSCALFNSQYAMKRKKCYFTITVYIPAPAVQLAQTNASAMICQNIGCPCRDFNIYTHRHKNIH
jgi:hypothetical protein